MLEDSIWLSLLWLIACVAVVLGAAYWSTRYLAGRGLFGTAKGRQLEVLDQLSLGKEQRLVVVQAGGRWFLLGVAAGEISTLAEFSEEEAACWKEAQTENPSPPSFREAFLVTLQKKGRR